MNLTPLALVGIWTVSIVCATILALNNHYVFAVVILFCGLSYCESDSK